MKLHPFADTALKASQMMERGAIIHQQFNCEHCGIKQTMAEPDKFFEQGECEECGKVTDLKKNGCNFMARFDLKRRPA